MVSPESTTERGETHLSEANDVYLAEGLKRIPPFLSRHVVSLFLSALFRFRSGPSAGGHWSIKGPIVPKLRS